MGISHFTGSVDLRGNWLFCSAFRATIGKIRPKEMGIRWGDKWEFSQADMGTASSLMGIFSAHYALYTIGGAGFSCSRIESRCMNKNSPYYHFDPDSIGWLHQRHKMKKLVSKADVIRLLEAGPENASDPLLQQYVLKALRGELKGVPGRPAKATMDGMRFLMAWGEYEQRLAGVQRNKKARTKYQKQSSIELADALARDWRLHCSGRSFLNRISRTKKLGRLW